MIILWRRDPGSAAGRRGEQRRPMGETRVDKLMGSILNTGLPSFSLPDYFLSQARRTKLRNSHYVATRVLLRGAGVLCSSSQYGNTDTQQQSVRARNVRGPSHAPKHPPCHKQKSWLQRVVTKSNMREEFNHLPCNPSTAHVINTSLADPNASQNIVRSSR